MEKAEVEKELEASKSGDFSKGNMKIEQSLVANEHSNRLAEPTKSIAYAHNSTSDKVNYSKRNIKTMKLPSPVQTFFWSQCGKLLDLPCANYINHVPVATKVSGCMSSAFPTPLVTVPIPFMPKGVTSNLTQGGALIKRKADEALKTYWKLEQSATLATKRLVNFLSKVWKKTPARTQVKNIL